MIGSIRTQHSHPTVDLFDRLVLRNLDKFALIVALVCIVLIGILH